MRTGRQAAWPRNGKAIGYGDLTFGYAAPVENLETEAVMPFSIMALHQNSFVADAALGGRKMQRAHVKAGDFSYIPKGIWQSTSSEKSGGYLYLVFDDGLRQRCETELGVSKPLFEPIDFHPRLERSPQYSALINDFLGSEGLGGRMRAEALASLLVCEILNFRGSTQEAVRVGLGKFRVAQILEYIDEHTDEELSLATLAEIAGVSVFHFSRMFKIDTGMTPHKFVLRHRVNKAREMLERSDATLAQIAYEVGFSSQSHMISSFKRFVGTSPGKYRKIIKQ
ncbi:AraC family transcriptional regulator [uncultured Tateyamaria sp.]|uniref:helix-turn-helix domain-containing protein n=1 Tax=uncultured Tateyamaria sp. TaxID=455651 RepID=UPI00262FF8BE|nr:AraC family transcriptional regulator [uncultured Tateyamaria sp.]